jgi:hypothetical protein
MTRSWRLLGRTVAAVAVALLLAPGAQAQFGALRLLGSIGRPAPASVQPTGAASGGDMLQLLSAVAGPDRRAPKEIEIGRQMAAVLLGSKPLHADMKVAGAT